MSPERLAAIECIFQNLESPELAKLELKPNDTLLVRLKQRCSPDNLVFIKEQLQRHMADIRVLVLDHDLDISVVSSTLEIEQLRVALQESLTLQSHYAELLNMRDGGERMKFATVDEWLERLCDCGHAAFVCGGVHEKERP